MRTSKTVGLELQQHQRPQSGFKRELVNLSTSKFGIWDSLGFRVWQEFMFELRPILYNEEFR